MFQKAPRALAIVAGLFLLAPAAVTTAHSAAAAAPPTGSIGIRLLDASSSSDPRTSLYIVNRLSPGAQVTRQIELSNTSSSPVAISVYASAASITKGSFTWADGRVANELTSWTSLDRSQVTVAGGGKTVENVRISVPGQVSTGERYAVIWAQVAGKPATGGGVQLVNRVGVRMYVSVGNGNVGAANFTLSQLAGHRDSKGVPSVTAIVHNTGGRALDLTGSLSLSSGPGASTAGPFKVTDATTLAAGQTQTITAALRRELPDGPWTGKLSLQAAGVSRETTGRVLFEAADQKSNGERLLIYVGGALGLIVIIVFLDQFRRRRQRQKPTVGQGSHRRHSSLR